MVLNRFSVIKIDAIRQAIRWTTDALTDIIKGMKANEVTIYTDMDGTALTDWDRGPILPPRNLEAIRAFVAAGGAFSVASGREAVDILRFFPGVEFRAPLVCGNGAVVYDAAAGKILRQISLPRAYKEEAAAYFLSRPGLWIVAADPEQIWQVTCGDPVKDAPIGDWDRPFLSLEEFLEDDRFIKMVYVLPDGVGMEQLKKNIAQFSSAGLAAGTQSGPRYLEMVEHTVSKADGIRFARQAAGLEDRKLICIGDYFNDLPMLQMADIAACPINGAQGIRDICRIITCGNNAGAVADLIEQLKLI